MSLHLLLHLNKVNQCFIGNEILLTYLSSGVKYIKILSIIAHVFFFHIGVILFCYFVILKYLYS